MSYAMQYLLARDEPRPPQSRTYTQERQQSQYLRAFPHDQRTRKLVANMTSFAAPYTTVPESVSSRSPFDPSHCRCMKLRFLYFVIVHHRHREFDWALPQYLDFLKLATANPRVKSHRSDVHLRAHVSRPPRRLRRFRATISLVET